MAFRLHDDLSWCECAGRAVFLDLERDRYFCLPADDDAAFRRWASSGEAGALDELARLAHAGVLTRDGEGRGTAPAAIVPPTRDLACEALGQARMADVVRVLAAQAWAQMLVRRAPLAGILRPIGCRPAGTVRPSDPDSAARRAAAALAAATLILPKTGRCLPRALAAHALCRSLGIVPALVFGVRLAPFAAHCWVQWDDAVIVGDLEEARLFTPILVVP